MSLNYWLISVIAVLTLVMVVMIANSGFFTLAIIFGLIPFFLFLLYIRFASKRFKEQLVNKENLRFQRLRQVGEISVAISHDINNILTTIIGFSNKLISQIKTGELQLNDVANIKNGTIRASNLVKNILKISKGKEIKKEQINVIKELKNLTPLLKALIRARIKKENIIFSTKFSPKSKQNGCFILINEAEFWQVISNLVANAADAMQVNGGTVLIEVTEFTRKKSTDAILADFSPSPELDKFVGNFVKISISDTGGGINKNILGKIFEYSFSTKENTGMGLGLTNIAKIIHELGGYIFVTSKSKAGAIFDIYLKAEKPTAAILEQKEESELARKEILTNYHILIVEDEEPIRDISKIGLLNAGYQVQVAANAQEALEIIQQTTIKFDLLISDFLIGDMDGIELAEKVKTYLPDIKILLTSGFEEDAIKSINQDNISFLAKPYQDHDLVSSVQKLLKY